MSVQPLSGMEMQQKGYAQNTSGFARPAEAPQHNTTIVINQQPSRHVNPMQPYPLRPWSTGLCGCMEDCGGCMFAFFCPLCYACSVSSKQGESCWGPCCVPAWSQVFRSHIRGVHSIEGSICGDCCVSQLCGICVLCQMGRELDNILKGDTRAIPAIQRM